MQGGLPLPRRFLAIFSASAGTVLLTMDASIAAIALPIIARDLHEAPSKTVLLISVYNVILAMTLLPFATLGDRMGQRRLYLSGLLVYIFAACLCYFADSLTVLIVLRGVQALGAAAALSVSIALVKAIYPSTHLGRGLGVNTIAGASGAAMAPALGGLILSFASWKWVFIAGVPLAVASMIGGRALPESEKRKERFDFLGAGLCAAMFGLLIGGFESTSQGYGWMVAGTILLAGIIVGVIFVRRQLKVQRPVLPVDLLAYPVLALSVTAAFTAVLASTIVLLFIPFRLNALGFSPAEIGGMLAPYAVASVVFAPLSAMLSDRISAGVLGTIGMTIGLAALLFLAFLPTQPSFYDIAWRMSMCGIGFSMFFSPNARLIISAAPADRAAAASSLISTTRMIGTALGSTLFGVLLGTHLGTSTAVLLVAAGLAAVALFCSAARLRPSLFQREQNG